MTFSILREARPSFPRAYKDFAAYWSREAVASALHWPRRLEVHVQERPDVSPGRNGNTARCFGCRNRFGFVNLIVLDSGVLCCRRCWESCEVLEVPDRKGTVEIVG